MKVLMTADAVGGVWTYSLTLARAMREFGADCTLAVMGPPPDAPTPGVAFHHHPCKLEWMEHPWRDVDAAGEWLRDLARRGRADLIHLNGYSHAAVDFGVPKIVVAHSCVCSWWRAVHEQPAPAEWNEYRRRVRAGLDAADLVVAPSAAMLNTLIAEHGPVARSAIIPNASDVARTLSPPSVGLGAHERSEKRRGNRLQPVAGTGIDEPVMLIDPARAFDPVDNATRDEIILAAARFGDRSKNLALLQQIESRLHWPIETAGAPHPLPHSEVLRHMSKAAIFCHPAFYEPFGLAPLEAALSGCALALSDIPSLRELWSGAAIFFNARDPDSAVAALTCLISNPDLRRDLAAAALTRARRFSPASQAEQYFSAYRSVVACSGRETAASAAWLT